MASREGNGGNDKVTAAFTFAKHVLETMGQVNESDLAAVLLLGNSLNGLRTE